MNRVSKRKQIRHKPQNASPLRIKLHEIIFEAETSAGKLFDIGLLAMILASIAVLMLESVPAYNTEYGRLFFALELGFTLFFTIEYLLRIYSVNSPRLYMFSFFGIIDLLSILPLYLTWFIPGVHSLMIIRGLRLIRIFRIFKLDSFVEQGETILQALKDSRKKILIFTVVILLLVCFFGSVMYLVEHKINQNFDNIPRSIYWAIVTITTVGYGDISPSSNLGQFVASIIMLMGYAIIAVPTGIVTSSMINAHKAVTTICCPNCAKEDHDRDAVFCKHCGYAL